MPQAGPFGRPQTSKIRGLRQPASAPAGRLSLPGGAEEVCQDTRATERRSLSAQRAAEPQVAAQRSERDLDKHGAPARRLPLVSCIAQKQPSGIAHTIILRFQSFVYNLLVL